MMIFITTVLNRQYFTTEDTESTEKNEEKSLGLKKGQRFKL